MQGGILLEYNIVMNFRFIFLKLLLTGCLSAGLWFPQATLIWAVSARPADNPPVAEDDTYITSENSFLTVPAPGVLQNDISGDPESLTASLVTGTGHGVLVLNSDGSLTYNPASNFSGTDNFTYTATDSVGTSNLAMVTLTILPVNHPPLPVDDQVSTLEDTPATIDVLTNDSDPDGNLDSTSVTIVSGATHGATTVDHLTGRVTYTPHLNIHGQDSFIYQVCDTASACARANVTVDVIFVNDSPDAVNDLATTPEDSPVTIDVTFNDTDVDGNLVPSTVTITRPAENGSTSVNSQNGLVTYQGHLNYNGSDNFGYQVCDALQACNTANVSITVTAVNDPPVANDDSTGTLRNTPVTVDVLANDTDPDGSTDLVHSSVFITIPAHLGSTSINPLTGEITYTPNPNIDNAQDSFRYRVCDHAVACAQANVTIAIAANSPPEANPDILTTNEDTAITFNVAANDTDPDGTSDLNPGSVTIVSPPSNGSVTVSPPNVTYTPKLNYNGSDSFIYQICDKGSPALCDSAIVAITVSPVNDAPVAMDDAFFMNQDEILTVNLPGVLENDNDIDGPVITAVLDQNPVHGTLGLNGDGSFTYRPQPHFAGQDTFTYHATDGSLPSGSVTAIITVYDTEPPKIILWLQPQVDSNQIYYVNGPTVTLEVTATDNVTVDRVRFSRWDPVHNNYVNIASIQVAPYVWQLDTSTLVLGFNQVYARAYDPSGNNSGQENFIWLVVSTKIYLPALLH
jgi:large repetitive protein